MQIKCQIHLQNGTVLNVRHFSVLFIEKNTHSFIFENETLLSVSLPINIANCGILGVVYTEKRASICIMRNKSTFFICTMCLSCQGAHGLRLIPTIYGDETFPWKFNSISMEKQCGPFWLQFANVNTGSVSALS